MLTDKVELEATVGIWPEPPFGSIKPSAIFVASGQIPEWNGDSLAIDPFPIFGICGISYGTQPILTIGITLQSDDTINELSSIPKIWQILKHFAGHFIKHKPLIYEVWADYQALKIILVMILFF